MTTFCDYYNRGECRSCTQIEIPPADQLLAKEEAVRAALDFLAPGDLPILPSILSKSSGFRNRAKMAVTGTLDDPRIGIVGEKTLDEGRSLLECPIHHPELNRLIGAMPGYIREFRLIPYRISEQTGELKCLIAFYSPGSGEMYLRFVLRSQECVSRLRKALPKLQAEFPALAVVTANLQPIPHAILEGQEEIFLTECRTITHRLGEFSFRLSPGAFVQTNASVATELYGQAAEWIAEAKPSKMLELYCGQGAFSFFAARSVPEILEIEGVDLNADGVESAETTARELGIKGLTFRVLDATRIESELETFQDGLVLVNPPRAGLRAGADLIAKNPPRHLIYSSCSLETLSRDLQKFSVSYRVRKVRIFDLFPHTTHFETLIWLERR
jgi:23S rRNA (uracil747-C5)-methyltransferase